MTDNLFLDPLPEFKILNTLRTYAHLMPEEETDPSFAEFGIEPAEKRMAIGAPKRPYTAPASGADFLESDNPLIAMARREGFDGSLRSAMSNLGVPSAASGARAQAALA
jgi:hypothetical protein